MSPALAQAALALLALAALAAGGAALAPAAADLLPASRAPAAVTIADTSQTPDLGPLLRSAAARAPFRATRVAPSVAYDPDRRPPADAPPPAPTAKPTLALSGIVWGAVPSAVLEGLPGVEGARVVRPGEVVSGLKVKRIGRDAVLVTGLDTAWTLKVRVPWR
jgi:hypothetical protein